MSKIKTGNFYKRISDGKLFKVLGTDTAFIMLVEARDVPYYLNVMAISVDFAEFIKEFAEPTELEKALL